jgi:formylglycine-generating enzyme required for sulfatase activity
MAGTNDLLGKAVMRFKSFIAALLLAALAAAPGHAEPPARQETPPAVAPLSAAQESAVKPQDAFRECAGCPEMVVAPAGSFTMGSPETEEDRLDDEGPQHVVTITKPFAVGRVHVTVDQFAAFVTETGYDSGAKCWTFEGGKGEERANRSWRNPGFAQDGGHPAVCLTWNNAQAYADWLAKKTGKPYRLLTEAEWEYAARGRTAPGRYPRFWFGDSDKDLCRYANMFDQKARDSIKGAGGEPGAPCNDGYAFTAPAGHYAPNAFGLHDMLGNAWQWTADCLHGDYGGAPADGSAWLSADCIGHVRRGGSWTEIARTAYRDIAAAALPDGMADTGFRVARTLGR